MTFAERLLLLPKAELHLHLEGAIPWELIRARSDHHLPEFPPWQETGFGSFDEFRRAMRECFTPCLVSPDSYREVAAAVFGSLREQNVRYVEISFGLGFLRDRGFSAADVASGIRSAAPPGLEVRIIAGIGRHRHAEPMETWLGTIADATELDGIDLHGDETASPAAHFQTVFRQARVQGLFCKAHAGEFTGPEDIWEVIDSLGVGRVEHGLSAFRDRRLVDTMVSRGITLDMCPTSNLRLGVVDDLRQHPLPALLDSGVRVTVNTDDPTLFGKSLTQELDHVREAFRFSWETMVQLQQNAFHAALLDDAARQHLEEELRELRG